MKRHELRQQIFQILFSLGFHSGEDIQELVLRYLDDTCEQEITDEERAEILKKVQGTAGKFEELDRKIDAVSDGWRVNRMGKAELTILRLALYEMLWDQNVPVKVAINEAVELAREYCNEASPAFINGILAKYAEPEAEKPMAADGLPEKERSES